ncbi:MarR family winged helix-turn-helix transcriptional regulator [Candidatus Pacearchaeota archaeon]|nr:MarR family winged helix-turn-helix transcriptional regulator [Candidatus Pacearchaeota archaeon]
MANNIETFLGNYSALAGPINILGPMSRVASPEEQILLLTIGTYSNEYSLTQRDLYRVYDIPPSSMNTITNRLMTKGLIKMVGDKSDKRYKPLILTDKGRKAFDIIKENIENQPALEGRIANLTRKSL